MSHQSRVPPWLPVCLWGFPGTPQGVPACAVVHSHDLLSKMQFYWHGQCVTVHMRACRTDRAVAHWHACSPRLLLHSRGRTEPSQQKLDGQKEAKLFIPWPFQKMFADPCPRRNT